METATDVRGTWEECMKLIHGQVNNLSYKTWFEPVIPVALKEKNLILRVPSQFFHDWLEEHYARVVSESVRTVIGETARVEYTISDEDTSESEPQFYRPSMPNRTTLHAEKIGPQKVNIRAAFESNLNARYTFENFIKGDSNQFARAAAYAVANNPAGTSFNPLVVYGGVGLGKTHLIQAIGNFAQQSGKAERVLYVSSERFTVDFVDAIQKDKANEFSNFYRSMDILIVDDIQFFAGKEKTQDTFFHTFNALHQSGKQIVLSSDRPPKELKGVDDRLVSRFTWGLTVDIQPPDLETRIAILRKKSEDDGIQIPDDVIEYVAANVTSNIRELEGCLISILAKASLNNREINVELGKEVIRNLAVTRKTAVTVEDIQKVVASFFDVNEESLRGKTRKQEVVIARQTAMHLTKELTQLPLKTIGSHFGGRDHSTVIYACQVISDYLSNDKKFREKYDRIKKKIEMIGM
ncbi:MAG TPA: chromosomal replication initiator protein DnaA [Candidatus Acidoferrales bacterium]|nr:chromosomal replication initiator protein DnaA [Candidatus Acidoferrales bacterium]